MTKDTTKQQVQDTETRILQIAEQEFMAKGFTGARTTSMAESAGVTHAMLHYYFRTKEKLFERIISEKIGLLKEAMYSSIGDFNLPLSEIIRNIINRHLVFLAANPELPRFLISEIISNPERSASFLENLHKYAPTIISILQNKIDMESSAGNCRKVDAKMLMLDIVSLNVFSYVASPIINAALGNCMADADAFLAKRKEENYDTIMRKLKP